MCSIKLLYLTLYGPLKAVERSGNEKNYLLAEVFSKAYVWVAAKERGISVFRLADISRLNSETFTEIEFETNEETKTD